MTDDQCHSLFVCWGTLAIVVQQAGLAIPEMNKIHMWMTNSQKNKSYNSDVNFQEMQPLLLTFRTIVMTIESWILNACLRYQTPMFHGSWREIWNSNHVLFWKRIVNLEDKQKLVYLIRTINPISSSEFKLKCPESRLSPGNSFPRNQWSWFQCLMHI